VLEDPGEHALSRNAVAKRLSSVLIRKRRANPSDSLDRTINGPSGSAVTAGRGSTTTDGASNPIEHAADAIHVGES
jgi:hypothetical protein